MEYNISLTGNPNVGKTSVYNRITHSSEHVGNWHGVTVTETSKKILYDHNTLNMVDLPGFYSLTIYSMEEGISRDRILSGNDDLIVNICEVNNLSRNLYLALQILELNRPMVLVINMMDELKKQGKVLNYRKLEQHLKVPIVPMSAKYHSDVHLLLDVSVDYIEHFKGNTVELDYLNTLPIDPVMAIIAPNASKTDFDKRWAAIKVLEKDSFVLEKLQLSDEQLAAIEKFGDCQSLVAKARYDFIEKITEGVFSSDVSDEHHEMHEHLAHKVPIEEDAAKVDESLRYDAGTMRHIRHHNMHKEKSLPYFQGFNRIDKVVLNKYLSLPIFLAIMMVIFILTFGLVGQWLSDLLALFFENCIYLPVTNWLISVKVADWIIGLVGEGIIHGLTGILVFLPQIVLLFFFLALLEDSGYISRVAFMTDGLFRKIGLSGRSAFTMLMGFGCSATAVLTARGLEDETMRRKTVLLTPFMSCSARLPVYTTIAGAFFAQGNWIIIFMLYVLGATVSLLLAALFEKRFKRLKSGKLSFIMEMPPYRFPTLERVCQLIWNNAKVFIIKVGTTIFALNVIVWILSNFSFTAGYTAGGESIMQSFSKFIAPVFEPLGFGSWEAVTSLISGFVAKEAVISTIESFGGAESLFVGEFASLNAVAFLVYTLLYVPCIATVAAMKKEIGLKWTLFGIILQLSVAYVAALIVRLIGYAYIIYTGIAVGVTIVALVAVAVIIAIVRAIKNRGRCSCGCGSCSKHCNKK